MMKDRISDNYSDQELEKLQGKDYDFNNVDSAIEFFGRFLHDGDYEKFQSVCYMDKSSKECLKLKIIAYEELTRALWIMTRFPKFLSTEFYYWHAKYVNAHRIWNLYRAQLEKLETGQVVKAVGYDL